MAAKEETVVQQVEVNLDELLGLPGSENVMVPTQPEKKPAIKPKVFQKEESATAFLDNPELQEEVETTSSTTNATDNTIDDIIDEATGEETDEDYESTESKITSPNSNLFKKLIEKELLYDFEGDKTIDEYTDEDFESLLEANVEEMRTEVAQDFFDNLPHEFKLAYKYFEDGNKDLKSLFKVLGAMEENRSLDPGNESDAEIIVRKHLTNTNYGTVEEIEEEIEKLKDREEIVDKANKFKPKLDAVEQQVIAKKLADQENIKKRQQAAAQNYMTNVYETLKPGQLNGVKLDKKTQSMLYYGLTEPNYPSVSGRPTNLLGHLLEKYQYVEPDHSLVAEALWLLADPKSYKKKLLEQGQTIAASDVAKKLKMEQTIKNSATPVIEKDERRTKRIKGNDDNFFKRF
jgi:hypothetical protein